jgi:hypothetical protein
MRRSLEECHTFVKPDKETRLGSVEDRNQYVQYREALGLT